MPWGVTEPLSSFLAARNQWWLSSGGCWISKTGAAPRSPHSAPSLSGLPSRGAAAPHPRSVVPMGPPRPTLTVAGCDPALPLLELPLSLLEPAVSFLWWPCASRDALALASHGLVHVAGVHLRGPSGDYNATPVAEVLPGGGELIGFCSWREGLVLRPEPTGEISGLPDAVRAGCDWSTGSQPPRQGRYSTASLRSTASRRTGSPGTTPRSRGTWRWQPPSLPGSRISG